MQLGTVVWDFYAGAYGPSILVELPDLGSVVSLQTIFRRVADTGKTIALQDEPGIRLSHMSALYLALAGAPPLKNLSKARDAFTWYCTADQWHRHIELLQPFLNGRIGHQYLTQEGVDDALIEISYGETHGRKPLQREPHY